ncbi:hypothetical protein [Polynucleobacter sphagniphilus]|uniref:hypothetical protein n=1 Tax=Polynucleobacter sphagniphilus TaxID=1743169 RepID=UPI00096B86F2|nr:hypothetical protein [Polynucleobacter sphagniphilus]MDH6154890.1 hypothetical protein [Polynucleobacter sphagniphilus]OLY95838.1 hypothetical protein BOQ04_07825 [Polynucleobacter sphagniphilus]
MSSRKYALLKFTFLAFILEAPLLIAYLWMMGNVSQARFNPRQMSEWLINYQGGFVRRGLVGEIILKISSVFPITTSIYAIVFWAFAAYVALFLVIYLKARIQDWSVLAVAILLQGGIFHMGSGGIFYIRKEGIFLVFFSILCLIYLNIQASSLRRRSIWIGLLTFLLLTISPLMVLMHEAYLFMGFPAAFLLLWIVQKENPDLGYLKKALIFLALEVVGLFVLCSMFHGDALQSQAIWDALPFQDRLFLSPTAPYTPLGPIDSVAWSLGQHLATIYGIFSTGGIFVWILFIPANGLALMYVLSRLETAKTSTAYVQFTRLALIGLLSSSAMFFIASDWGRWLAYLSNQTVLLMFILDVRLFTALPTIQPISENL